MQIEHASHSFGVRNQKQKKSLKFHTLALQLIIDDFNILSNTYVPFFKNDLVLFFYQVHILHTYRYFSSFF